MNIVKITKEKLKLATRRNFNEITQELRTNLERMGVSGLTVDIRWDTRTNVSFVRFAYKGKNYEMRADNQRNALLNMFALSRRVEWKARMHLLGIEDFDISVSPYLQIGTTYEGQGQYTPPPRAGAKHYAMLGIPEYSSNDEIERKYKQLARSFHPDMALSEEAKREFEKRFAEINEAYSEIKKERGM